jgi:hypothetical protein
MMSDANEVVQSIKLSKAEKEAIKAQKAQEAILNPMPPGMISSAQVLS